MASVLEEILLEEYDRSARMVQALDDELSSLPRGSIREKVIKGRPYCYLQYRDGDHVRSVYVPRADVEGIRAQLESRARCIRERKEQVRAMRQIERALGRRLSDERAGA